MTRKMIGLGTAIGVSASSGTSSYTTIAGVVKIDGPKGDADEIDTSTLDDTNWKTFQRGLADGGEYTFTMAYGSTDAASKKLGTLWKTGTVVRWKFDPSSTALSTESFAGFVKSMGRSGIEKNSMVVRDVTVKVTGNPGFPTT